MNKNGMGPQNSGPLTGRGMGNCNKNFNSNADNAGYIGRGMGRSKGRGCGMGTGGGKVLGRRNGMEHGRNAQGMQAESVLMMRIEVLEAEIQALKGNK